MMYFPKRKHTHLAPFVVIVLAALSGVGALGATPLSATFGYQGRLTQNGTAANGDADFQVAVWDGPGTGDLMVTPIILRTATVVDGAFTLELNFGFDVFKGDERWLEIAVRFPAGSGSFTTLTPRQRITATPYALAMPGRFTLPHQTSPNLIGGLATNAVSQNVFGATIGGGGSPTNVNAVTGAFGTVAGGRGNTAGDSSFVGGGTINTASGIISTIGGGQFNTAMASSATVSGGLGNSASALASTVGGGANNTASGQFATVAGGDLNTASGSWAMVPGGQQNVATGNFSFAAGRRAKATTPGTFVWADSTNVDFNGAGNDGFFVRCSGGVRFNTSANLSTGVFCFSGSSAWSSISDRDAKTNIEPVNPIDALNRVLDIPISTWNYKAQDASIRHIGPMAQDFHAAFGVGESDKLITTIDADGVALAAIQGLHQMVQDKTVQINVQQHQLDRQHSQIESQKREIEDMRIRLDQIEARLMNTSHSNGGKP